MFGWQRLICSGFLWAIQGILLWGIFRVAHLSLTITQNLLRVLGQVLDKTKVESLEMQNNQLFLTIPTTIKAYSGSQITRKRLLRFAHREIASAA
jgi:hypothetical protein